MVGEDGPGEGSGKDEPPEDAQEGVRVEEEDEEIIEYAQEEEGEQPGEDDDLALLAHAVGEPAYRSSEHDNAPGQDGDEACPEEHDAGGGVDQSRADEDGAPGDADDVGCENGSLLSPLARQPVDEMEENRGDEGQRALERDGVDGFGHEGAAVTVVAEVPEEEDGVHQEERPVEGVLAGVGEGEQSEKEV